jgi:hypothetical protein
VAQDNDRLVHYTIARQGNSGKHLALAQVSLAGKYTYTGFFNFVNQGQ